MKIETDRKVLKSIQDKVPRLDNPTRDNPSQVLNRSSHNRKSSTNIQKNAAKPISWYEQWRFLNSWKENEASEDFINKLCDEIFNWAQQDDSLTINQFICKYDVSDDAMQLWKKKWPQFAAVYKRVKRILAARREVGMLKFELHYQAGAYNQWHYCDMWKESGERQAKLRTPEQITPGDITVVMNEFPKEDK
jgi:hypothetical protein